MVCVRPVMCDVGSTLSDIFSLCSTELRFSNFTKDIFLIDRKSTAQAT